MIQVKKVSKIYETAEVAAAALCEVSFSVRKGEYVLLTGRSGSGKSTLLNILSGVDSATKGEVTIEEERITGYTEDQLAGWRGKQVGIIFQFFQLIPTLSVLENILLPMDIVGKIPKKQREEKAAAILELVGMEAHKDKMPSALSGGEQQRIGIARSLANDAPILFADEPTGNLDSENAAKVFELLRRLNEQGRTIIMVTHEREDIPGAGRKIILKDGRIIEDTMIQTGGRGDEQTSI